MTVKIWPGPPGMNPDRGTLYPCHICGRGVHADDAVKRDGAYYHPITCWDDPNTAAKQDVFGPRR